MEQFLGNTGGNKSSESSESMNQRRLAMEYIRIHEDYTMKSEAVVVLGTQLNNWRNEGHKIDTNDPTYLRYTQLSGEVEELKKQFVAIGEQLTEETKEEYLRSNQPI